MDKNQMFPMVAAILIAVALAATAVYVLLDDNDEDQTANYQMYIEVIGTDGTVTSAQTIEFIAESKTNEAFIEAANAAFAEAGINAVFTLGDYVSFQYSGSTNNACYYRSGSEWVLINDTNTQYVNNSELALMVGNGYISEAVYNALPVAQKAGYMDTGYGGPYAYAKIPDVNSYECYVEIIGADGKVTDMKNVSFSITNNSLETYVDAANNAFADAGLNATFTLTEHVSIDYNGSINNATYFYDGSAWQMVTDTNTQYVGNSTLAFMLGNGYISESVYDGLSVAEQAGYSATGYGGSSAYMKLPDEVEYTIAFEVVEADGLVSESGYVAFSTYLYGNRTFAEVFNEAFSSMSIPVSIAIGDYVSVYYDGSMNNACYYYDGSAWQTVFDTNTQYISNKLLGFAFGNGYVSADVYDALSAEQQAGFDETGYGGSSAYVKIMDPVRYDVHYEVIEADGTVSDNGIVEFGAPVKTLEYFIPAFNKAFADAGISASLTLADYLKLSYNGSGSNACYYYDPNSESWIFVTDTATQYVENEILGFAFGNGYISADVYDELSAELQAGYLDSGYGGAYAYRKLIDDFTYSVMYEVMKADATVDTTGKVVFSIPLPYKELFVSAFNKAFEDAAVPATAIIKNNGSVSIKYDESGNNACYYFGEYDWVKVADTAVDYVSNPVLGFAFGNGYISEAVYSTLTDEQKAGYEETGMGYGYDYIKLMDSTRHTVYYQIIGDDGVASASQELIFVTPEDSIICFAGLLNKAFAEAGVTATMSEIGWITYGENGFDNATYYADLGTSEWVDIWDMEVDYVENAVVALMLNHGYISDTVYDSLNAEQQAGYKSTGSPGDYAYMKIPDAVLA